MTVSHILDGLEGSTATGRKAEDAARQSFLVWALLSSGNSTPQAAHSALATLANRRPSSAAAQAFVSYLQQATCHVTTRARRRRGPLH